MYSPGSIDPGTGSPASSRCCSGPQSAVAHRLPPGWRSHCSRKSAEGVLLLRRILQVERCECAKQNLRLLARKPGLLAVAAWASPQYPHQMSLARAMRSCEKPTPEARCPATALRMCVAIALARWCSASHRGWPAVSAKVAPQQPAGQRRSSSGGCSGCSMHVSHSAPPLAAASGGVVAAASAWGGVAVGSAAASAAPAAPSAIGMNCAPSSSHDGALSTGGDSSGGAAGPKRGEAGGDGSFIDPTSSASYSSSPAAGSPAAIGQTCCGHALTISPTLSCTPSRSITCTLRSRGASGAAGGGGTTRTLIPPDPCALSSLLPALVDRSVSQPMVPGTSGATAGSAPTLAATLISAAIGWCQSSSVRCSSFDHGSQVDSASAYPLHRSR